MRRFILLLPLLACAADPKWPDAKITPGATFPFSKAHICMPGYAKSVRKVPASLKTQVFAEYNIKPKAGRYEVDHLVSLELGGSNDIENLWPQSYSGTWNAHDKDRLENRLHLMVCRGDIELKTAQKDISADWIAAYQKEFSNSRGRAGESMAARHRLHLGHLQ